MARKNLLSKDLTDGSCRPATHPRIPCFNARSISSPIGISLVFGKVVLLGL